MATLTGYEVVLSMVLICISIKINMGFPGDLAGKESACDAGGPCLIPGLERSAGEGIGYPLQYFQASLVAQLVKNPHVM